MISIITDDDKKGKCYSHTAEVVVTTDSGYRINLCSPFGQGADKLEALEDLKPRLRELLIQLGYAWDMVNEQIEEERRHKNEME